MLVWNKETRHVDEEQRNQSGWRGTKRPVMLVRNKETVMLVMNEETSHVDVEQRDQLC